MADQHDLFAGSGGLALPSNPSRLITLGKKYRNQPFEVLLADASYALWLLNSMHTKLQHDHPALFTFLISRFGVPDSTPDHNRLQNRFLDRTFALKFAYVASEQVRRFAEALKRIDIPDAWRHYVASELRTRLERARREPVSEQQRQMSSLCTRLTDEAEYLRWVGKTGKYQDGVWECPVSIESLQFEDEGADVRYLVVCGFSVEARVPGNERSYGLLNPPSIGRYHEGEAFRVEVKPIVGDDYPAVLRAMKAVKSKQLLVGEYCGAGATWDEVVRVFKLSGITAVLLDDVESVHLPREFDQTKVVPISKAEATSVVEGACQGAMVAVRRGLESPPERRHPPCEEG